MLCGVCIEGIDVMVEFVGKFVYDNSEKNLFSFMNKKVLGNFFNKGEVCVQKNIEKFNASVIYAVILIKRSIFISMCWG
ncbi:hypothetical protein GGR08_000298 [Bartonella fuyuanensis]|uniref:Uncharacterized protein n=1 Tax=Bartonella fuyuanensis TaxID=1460968 RepID=A0A840DZK2_9HYPH|nr:hypothetical protein [Bartonella fuyuanensis]